MANDEVILRFSEFSFSYGHNRPVLSEASFSVRRGAKITLMGQNGAGKSTIFGIIIGKLKPDRGSFSVAPDMTIATARQVIPRDELEITVRDFFSRAFKNKVYDIDPRIEKILEVVHLAAPFERIVSS